MVRRQPAVEDIGNRYLPRIEDEAPRRFFAPVTGVTFDANAYIHVMLSHGKMLAPRTGPGRLLCDEMLHRMARFLRAAGYDTAVAARSQSDGDLLVLAQAQERVFVTRDRKLVLPSAMAVRVVRLDSDGLDDGALELRTRLGIDWLRAPFTRCLIDNASLRPADESELVRVPATARALGGPVTACPACGRLYWPGSHVRRMHARLSHWRRGLRPPVQN